jgi:hypothetical protein
MTPTHKFPMPTVSSDLTTSDPLRALEVSLASWKSYCLAAQGNPRS